MDEKIDMDFAEWTIWALKEKDIDRFIKLLMEREEFSKKLCKKAHIMSPDEAKDALKREEEVLTRLESEKTRVIHELDELSLCVKAVRAYKARFPIPPMPDYFINKNKFT
ncbi:MAG: hypothetical protein PHU49_16970 [Syntrophorhabdaceae bacterium]|jgi:hypothetical protein|nr:hypothetical protein [Syntrophorhabdaceae bacterium]MDD5245701.1 hypothetical protein [Syntrophorhabdaceae bacterium]